MASRELHVKLTEVETVKELLAAANDRVQRAEEARDVAQAGRNMFVERARRAEAAISSVRALLAERQAGKFWYVRVADVLDVLDSPPAAPVPEERSDEAPKKHASPNCACGVNDAGQRYIDPICRES